ncbi:LPS assembly protein LptD [Rheinheimera muenzenbergensis]|uniref:LPS-assembly protein LptD n=1 Tax=Rheinheimera muenzenbergensis TaxID=1193628 RepID=A0ABU8CA07_9GAMM
MKHGLAVVFLFPIFNATVAQAEAVSACYVPLAVPAELSQLDVNDPAIRIASDHADMEANLRTRFSGQVEIRYRDTLLLAPQANFDRDKQTINADGGIQYYNQSVQVQGAQFSADLLNNAARLDQASYHFLTQAGRGDAKRLTAGDQQLLLENALFTTCPQSDNSWGLHATKINIEAGEGWGEAHHAVFKIKDIPVFYLPYLTFPVTEQRRSGVLLPKFGSSQKLGAEFELPYYFNLAPNYDLTLTPRYMSKRGAQLKSAFRYLTEQHQGTLQLEYLNSDNDKPDNFGQRYLAHISHVSDFTEQWRGFIDLTDVSDDAYLSELGSDYNNQSDTQLLREANLSYYGEQVHSQLRMQGFEILGNYNKAYSTLPELSLASAQPLSLLPGINFDWQAQYAHFRNDQADIRDADRIHLEPKLVAPFITPAFELTAEASLLYTYYQQDAADDNTAVASSVSRTIPKVRLHSKLNLEREYDWFGETGLQTFEPQLQYLYIPYRDQSAIGLYDTARLQDDYYGLFRQNRYSGLDRINQANQLTVGWTSRFYDNIDNELFRFSLGQIFFLDTPVIQPGETDDLSPAESMLAAELIWHWFRKWYFSSAVQYDIDNDQVIKSSASLDYRASDKSLFQLNHRYSRAVSGVEIQQLGMLGTMPVSEQWQLVASYYRDLTNHRMIDASIGMQYESCCWAVRLIAKRQLLTDLELPVGNFNDYSRLDTSIGVQFVLKGFGDSAGFGVTDMLSNGIFSYRRPFLLTN